MMHYFSKFAGRLFCLLLFVHIKIIRASENGEHDTKCEDCRLVSQSIDEIIRMPRQMNTYGQMDDRIDLEKIKKRVCTDIVSDHRRQRCRQFYFTQLPTIQKWKHSNTRTNFFDYVCIRELKVCCPVKSYGPKCTKCIECAKNQHCHGEGTRQGNGTCICKDGYTGSNCSTCLKGYYQAQINETKEFVHGKPSNKHPVVCKQCHRSCQYCRQAGPSGCEVCKSGFTWVPAYGCSDIDECIKSNNKICGDNTFCVNTEGSYFCYECDRACDGCHGDGPDMCLRCSKGYKLDPKGNCVSLKRTILPPEVNYYRYAIYTGLLICACIIFHTNIYWASFIGLAVALYIGFSEYVMSTHLREIEEAQGKPSAFLP